MYSRGSSARALCGTRHAWKMSGPYHSATMSSQSCRRKRSPVFCHRFSPWPTAVAAPCVRFPRRTRAGFPPHALTFLVRRNPYSVPPLAAERDENHDEIEKRALETQAKRPTKRKNAHKSIVSKTELFETGFFARENRLLLIFDIFCAIFPIDGNAEYCALLVQTWTEYGFCPM